MAEQDEPRSLDELAAEVDENGEVSAEAAEGSDDLEMLKRERDEIRDRFIRALADAENTRKRAERDRRVG